MMKSLPKFSYPLWLFLILAIGLLFSGCAKTHGIWATDGEYGDKIEVTWNWDGCLGKEVDHYILYRSSTGPGAPCGGEYAQIGLALTKAEYTDTDVLPSTVYWYKVEPYAGLTAGDESRHDAGVAGNLPSPSPDCVNCLQRWINADQCFHQNINAKYPNPEVDPGLGNPIHWDPLNPWVCHGVLDAVIDLNKYDEAVADFNFFYYHSMCTREFDMTGYQKGILKLLVWDGEMTGSVCFVEDEYFCIEGGLTEPNPNPGPYCTGCVDYYLEVTNKQSTGGHYYINCNFEVGAHDCGTLNPGNWVYVDFDAIDHPINPDTCPEGCRPE